MEYKIRTQPEEWASTKFCRIAMDDDAVENFILWLCDHSREQIDERLAAHNGGVPVWYDPVESTWGWDAPRQRIAKLLWQLLHGGASDEEFRTRFTFGRGLECVDSAELLAPIQERLKWVMAGLFDRERHDNNLGQSDWGERWWLPAEQGQFVREQLKETHAELIEQSSDYGDAICHSLCFHVRHVVQAIAIPCQDPGRVYIGERGGPCARVFVWVQDTNGTKHPLKHGQEAYLEADGTGFEWGYPGYGPGALTRCILADALDGDLVLADELDRIKGGFFEKFVLDHPRDVNLRISRLTVMEWLKSVGKLARYEERRKAVADRLEQYAEAIAEKEGLLARIQQTGGLRSQRFDVVPKTFEAALYLDLMRMLDRGGAALQCSGCGLPIPFDHSGRANRQRARSKKGQPIYHLDCFAESSKTRKKSYWHRRSQSLQFREDERVRARDYRKLT